VLIAIDEVLFSAAAGYVEGEGETTAQADQVIERARAFKGAYFEARARIIRNVRGGSWFDGSVAQSG
jgi:hypothetical protein